MDKTVNKKKVAVALSGGVDSSVTCYLLKERGYDVVGITAKMLDNDDFLQVVNNAKAVCEKLDIPHYVLDLSVDFKKYVTDYFDESYKNGITPNPCVICNKKIKWGKIFDYAMNELNCDYFATGHYAQIKNINGKSILYPAKDEKKDQLYYLTCVSQECLAKTIFPLSDYTKDEIRKIAEDNDLPSKSAKESQDTCFISKSETTKKYLNKKFKQQKGNFVLRKENKTVGTHNGYFEYTIGQRKGIGIAYKEPLYVTDIDTDKNIVYLGTKDELLTSTCKVKNVNYYSSLNDGDEVLAKIRYNTEAAPAKVNLTQQGLELMFKDKVSAVAKGQYCVIYDKEEKFLIAGGEIE